MIRISAALGCICIVPPARYNSVEGHWHSTGCFFLHQRFGSFIFSFCDTVVQLGTRELPVSSSELFQCFRFRRRSETSQHAIQGLVLYLPARFIKESTPLRNYQQACLDSAFSSRHTAHARAVLSRASCCTVLLTSSTLRSGPATGFLASMPAQLFLFLKICQLLIYAAAVRERPSSLHRWSCSFIVSIIHNPMSLPDDYF